jgi:hypothetical protein
MVLELGAGAGFDREVTRVVHAGGDFIQDQIAVLQQEELQAEAPHPVNGFNRVQRQVGGAGSNGSGNRGGGSHHLADVVAIDGFHHGVARR